MPFAELTAWSPERRQHLSACFDDVGGDDIARIDRGLQALAALLDAGMPEAMLVAEFRRRGLGDAALEMRMVMIRARQGGKA